MVTGYHFLTSKLKAVRWRLRARRVLHGLAAGLFWGAVGGCLLTVGRAGGLPMPEWLVWGIPIVSMIASGLYYGIQTVSQCDAGAMIDATYQLKDRMVTAIEFCGQSETDPMQGLQLADTIERARCVDPKVVVPRLLPARWPHTLGAIGVFLLAYLFVFISHDARISAEGTQAPAVPSLSARIQRTLVASLRQRAADAAAPDARSSDMSSTRTAERLGSLADEIESLAQDMQQPATERRTALARLSEIQAAIAEAQMAFQHAKLEPQLKTLGRALASDWSTQRVGKALARGNMAEAAAAFEQLDLQALRDPERRALARKLQRFAQRFNEAGLAELAAATEQLAAKVEAYNSSAKTSQIPMASLLREYAARWSAEQYLTAQLRAISDARVALNSGEGSFNAMLGENAAPSLLTGTTGVGPTERLTTNQRDLERLSGTSGKGPSSWETTLVKPDTAAAAKRPLASSEIPMRNRTEAALDLESLPLGYRQTIRRYFQGTRP